MEPGKDRTEPNWRWLMPVIALVIIAVIGVVTKQYLSSKQSSTTYKIAMVAVGDKSRNGEKTACGDTVVRYEGDTSIQLDLSEIFIDLLSNKKYDFYDGLKNPLYKSDLKIDSVQTDEKGKAIVRLSGKVVFANDCEAQQIKLQLQETAKAYKGVKSVDITINGKNLNDAFKL